MKETKRGELKTTTGRRFKLPLSIAFFVLFYGYFVFEIDLRLIYHGAGLIDNFPTFNKDWDFFRPFLGYPGGLVEYVSAFLAQSFYYSWLGAAVLTGQAWMMSLCTNLILASLQLPRWRALRFVPALLLLAVYSQYAFHFPETMGFLIALAAVCLYLKFRPKQPIAAIALFLAISIILYVAAGGAYLLFALLCGSVEVLFRRAAVVGLVQLAIGTALPYGLGVLLYGQWVHDAYFELLPLSWKITHYAASELMLGTMYALYAFLPGAVIVLGVWRLFWDRFVRHRAPSFKRLSKALDSIGTAHLGLNLQTLLVTASTVAVLLLARDTKLRMLYQVDYCSHQRMWPRVLELGRKSPYHYLTCHAVDRALYHTGKLGDEMFAFPQRPAALFLTDKQMLWQKAETCLDMGLINEAENALMVSLEALGPRPQLLERLARVNIVKGNVSVARTFLHALAKVPFWGSTANDYLSRLAADPTFSADPEIQRLRALRLRTDFVRQADSFSLLLSEDPTNRMAYEYNMARLLLETRGGANPKNLAIFAKTFETLHAQHVSSIPKHYEEALWLFRVLNKRPLEVPGQPIAQETKDRLVTVLKAVKEHGKNKAALRDALYDKVGDSYFYYFFVGG